MPGIYLVVWDANGSLDVLLPTPAGWPHVTLAYTGKNLTEAELKDTAGEVFHDWALKPLTIYNVRMNSFETLYHGQSVFRHDVLLDVDEVKEVAKSREKLVKKYPDRACTFFMRPPHVTVGTYYDDLKAANQHRERVAARLLHGPLLLKVIGVTID